MLYMAAYVLVGIFVTITFAWLSDTMKKRDYDMLSIVSGGISIASGMCTLMAAIGLLAM